jgi:hypothetical protein
MKTLKESILSSTNTGKKSLIETWCKKYLKSDYEITKDLKIKLKNNTLNLHYEDYDELPDYIEFEDNPKLHLSINSFENPVIKSFRGLPKICNSLIINHEFKEIPELSIKANFVSLACKDTKTDNFYFDFFETPERESTLIVRDISFKNVHANKFKCLSVSDDSRNGKIVYMKLIGFAPTNTAPKKNWLCKNEELIRYCDKPWTNGAQKIAKYFNQLDTTDLETINLGTKAKVIKHNNEWYKIEFK